MEVVLSLTLQVWVKEFEWAASSRIREPRYAEACTMGVGLGDIGFRRSSMLPTFGAIAMVSR